MGKRSNSARTARHTEATAKSNEQILRADRRRELVERGLIPFNAPEAVVLGLERHLAAERGERIDPIGNRKVRLGVGWTGVAMFVVGCLVVAASPLAWLALSPLGFFMACGGFSAAAQSTKLATADAAFEAFKPRHDFSVTTSEDS